MPPKCDPHMHAACLRLDDTREADRLVDEYQPDKPEIEPPPLLSKAEIKAFWAGVRAAREVTRG